MLSVVLLAIILWGAYFLKFNLPWKRRRLLELAARVPTHKSGLPIIGHLLELYPGTDGIKMLNKYIAISDVAEEAGGVLALWVGPYVQFVINDPDDALTVMNACVQKHYLYYTGEKFFGDGLFGAKPAQWKRNRKLLNPTFNQQVLDGFIGTFNKFAAQLAQNLEPLAGQGDIDPRALIFESIIESVCQTAVGVSLDSKSLIGPKYKKAVERGFDIVAYRMMRFWLHSDFLLGLTSLNKLINETINTFHETASGILEKRRIERQEEKQANTPPRRYKAFMDLILDVSEESGMFTDEQIRHEVNTIIVAGQDTSSRALNTILIYLGSFPEVQEKVHEELTSVVGDSFDVDGEHLKRLVYTEAVIKEALRLIPTGPFVARHIHKEVKLKNYTLPAGSDAFISLWGVNRLPIWGPDRLQFRPERWLDPASLPQSPGAYGSFSLGRRNCIAKTCTR